MGDNQLNGWKEIAAYLHKSVRTAQRYERELGLPVRRLPPPSADVFALKTEINEWRLRTPAGTSGDEEADDRDPEPENAAETQPDGAGPTVQAPPRLPKPRRSSPLDLSLGVLLLVVAAAGWIGWRTLVRSSATRGAAAPAGEARPAAASSVLDPGPWPTRSHDMRRTAQSAFQGPARAAEPKLVYQLPAGAEDSLVEVAATRNGLVAGRCGALFLLAPQGRAQWETTLETSRFFLTDTTGDRRPVRLWVRPAGITVDLKGNIWVTGIECPDDVPGSLRTGLFWCDFRGKCRMSPQGSSYAGPAVGPDYTVYTLDETTFLRARASWSDQKWADQLAGFSSRGLAVDADGNLYTGTDGGLFGEASLWSIAPDGKIRWRALADPLGLPVIGPDGRIFVASRSGTGQVYAFTPDGRKVWATTVGGVSSLSPLAVGRSGTIYVHATDQVIALTPDGRVKWRFSPRVGGNDDGSPVLDRDENVYAALGDWIVAAAPNGTERWRVPLKTPTYLISGGEGVLYAVSEQRRIYEIGNAIAGDAGPQGAQSR